MSFEFDYYYYYYYYYFVDIDWTYFAAVVLVFGREIRFAAVDVFQTP